MSDAAIVGIKWRAYGESRLNIDGFLLLVRLRHFELEQPVVDVRIMVVPRHFVVVPIRVTIVIRILEHELCFVLGGDKGADLIRQTGQVPHEGYTIFADASSCVIVPSRFFWPIDDIADERLGERVIRSRRGENVDARTKRRSHMDRYVVIDKQKRNTENRESTGLV